MTLERNMMSQIRSDLLEKMVLVAGPRQVGKTTLSKRIRPESTLYLNYDIPAHRRRILKGEFDESRLWVLDEIHKAVRWKNLLKGIADDQNGKREILVTGSARLDLARKAGDSLQGRYHLIRLHPLTYREISGANQKDLRELFNLGGFPEPFFSSSQTKADRWSNEYQSRLIDEDISRSERIVDLAAFEMLALRLPELVSNPLSVNALREDLGYNFATVRRWLLLLEKFYALFFVEPFGSPRIKAVKKERKHYHYDWNTIESKGARFECMVGVHLLKYVQNRIDCEGRKMELRYFRDIEGREVDFVVTEKNRPILAVECKFDDSEMSDSLRYFKRKFPEVPSWQISLEGKKDFLTRDGIRVAPAIQLLKDLS
jgi:predicted AAA+ superfamily ATPase